MSSNSGNIADTFDWDTVFAIPISEVNKAIISGNSSPPTFSQTVESTVVTGTFDHWQITTGGDGKLIKFAVPIKEGVVTFGKDIPYTACTARVELELDFFDNSDPKFDPADGSKVQYLKVNHQPLNPGDKVATVEQITFADGSSDLTLIALIKSGLEAWLNANLQMFGHVFATVNLNKVADEGKYEWLYPTSTSYAYLDRENVEDSALGILCMTQNHSMMGLTQQLSPFIIPDGSKAGFLISASQFLECMVKPTLPTAFDGLKSTDVQLSTDGQSLELATDSASFTVTTDDGTSYDMILTDFEIRCDGTTISMNSTAKTEASPGIWSWTKSEHVYQLKLVKKSDGTQTITYELVTETDPDNWTTSDEGIEIAKIVLEVIAVIVLAVLTVLTDGAALIVASIVAGLVMGAAEAAPDIAALAEKDDAPDLTLLMLNISDPLNWTDTKNFDLNFAGLNGSLQLGGVFSA